MEKGKYYEYEHRLLHSLFQSLVDYVEIEEAWCQASWGDDEKKYKSTHRFWWNEWRCPGAGVDRLVWQAKLVCDKDMGVDEDSPNFGTPTSQSVSAQEILDLYNWWKIGRPARPDPYEASGWIAFNAAREAITPKDMSTKAKRRAIRMKRTPEERAESSRLFEVMNKIEAEYDAEDELMMIRLIKIRKSMWT